MRRKPLFPPPVDATSGKKKRNKGKQPTTVLTINGRVRLRRTWWHSAGDGSEAPIDRVLSRDGATVTRGVCELACRLNNDAAGFDKAADNLKRAAQVAMSGEQLRLIVLSEGQRVLAAQQANAVKPSFTARDCRVKQDVTPAAPAATTATATTSASVTSAAAELVGVPIPKLVTSLASPSRPSVSAASGSPSSTPVKTRMYVGVDGVMVPVVTDSEKQKRREKVVAKRRVAARPGRPRVPLPPRRRGADQSYKEFKTITFYDESNEHHHVLLSRVRRPQVGSLLRREATRLKFLEANERITNVDGASWIPPQLDAAHLQLHGRGLDFYHLAENVHEARRSVFGSENSAGQTWAATLLHTFKHDGYEAAHEQLLKWLTPLRGHKRAAAKKLLNYITERRDMINYPEFTTNGWQLGSGPTEARCKTGTTRLKRSGARWNLDNAESVAALTNLRDSDQWQPYWTTPNAAKL